jgi:hypothetical protein
MVVSSGVTQQELQNLQTSEAFKASRRTRLGKPSGIVRKSRITCVGARKARPNGCK